MPQSALLAPSSTSPRSAILSGESPPRYRYALERRWGSGPFVMFVGLNPSTADAETDDMTVRKCCGFARRWGAGGILIGNLYALRSTHPVGLSMVDDPIGNDCDTWLAIMALKSIQIVACWGASPYATPARVKQVREIVGAERSVACLGMTKAGFPRHPSRIGYDTELIALPV